MIVLQSLTGRDMVRPGPSGILPAPIADILLGRTQDVDAIPVQEELTGVTPSETIIAVAPVRAGPGVVILDAEGTTLRSPEQKSQSRFADFYHDNSLIGSGEAGDSNGADAGLSREAFSARVPAERGGFLRM